MSNTIIRNEDGEFLGFSDCDDTNTKRLDYANLADYLADLEYEEIRLRRPRRLSRRLRKR